MRYQISIVVVTAGKPGCQWTLGVNYLFRSQREGCAETTGLAVFLLPVPFPNAADREGFIQGQLWQASCERELASLKMRGRRLKLWIPSAYPPPKQIPKALYSREGNAGYIYIQVTVSISNLGIGRGQNFPLKRKGWRVSNFKLSLSNMLLKEREPISR